MAFKVEQRLYSLSGIALYTLLPDSVETTDKVQGSRWMKGSLEGCARQAKMLEGWIRKTSRVMLAQHLEVRGSEGKQRQTVKKKQLGGLVVECRSLDCYVAGLISSQAKPKATQKKGNSKFDCIQKVCIQSHAFFV